jgi:hypothetical protein
MLLSKRQGGTVQTDPRTGKRYTWKSDGQAIPVPDDLAAELLAIRGGGFYVPEPEPAKPAKAAVTEPAPSAKAAVTEPAPKASPAQVLTEGKSSAK